MDRADVRPVGRRLNLAARVGRLLRLRLIVPILRTRQRPHHSARGVLFGLLIAMTPTVGAQMPLVFLLWLVMRRLYSPWDFNVVIALAWTGATNLVTTGPFYFVFVFTGWLLLGRLDEMESYAAFKEHLSATLHPDAAWYETLWVHIVSLFDVFGLPLFVGCIPWAIGSAALGYWSTFWLIRRYVARRQARATAMAAG